MRSRHPFPVKGITYGHWPCSDDSLYATNTVTRDIGYMVISEDPMKISPAANGRQESCHDLFQWFWLFRPGIEIQFPAYMTNTLPTQLLQRFRSVSICCILLSNIVRKKRIHYCRPEDMNYVKNNMDVLLNRIDCEKVCIQKFCWYGDITIVIKGLSNLKGST